jgi:hypothetical protein
LSQYTLAPDATVKELGENALPWISTKAGTLIRVNGWVNTLEPAVAITFTVALTTVAPVVALRVTVTGLWSWAGRLTELGLKMAVTPVGRPVAENV